MRLVERHGLQFHLYADDRPTRFLLSSGCYGITARPYVHLYRRGRTVDAFEPPAGLNTAKNEVMWCSSARRQHQVPSVPLTVDQDAVTPVRSVCDLCIYTSTATCRCGHSSIGLCSDASLFCVSCAAFGRPSACRSYGRCFTKNFRLLLILYSFSQNIRVLS
jgi:hypothetical protein